ncbi:MAG: hypothetical protein MI685_09490 [Chlorobiales bacterium]|nr:hypothetical protein [Chlorobiales bacterium]
MKVLERYSIQQITRGFSIWIEEQDEFPTPADIKKTIDHWKPMDKYKPPVGRQHFPSDEEIENVSKMMDDIRNNLNPDDRLIGDNEYRSSDHFTKMTPPDFQKKVIANLKNITKHGTTQ